jgi:hypothetical protein
LDILLQHLKAPPNLPSPDASSFDNLDNDDDVKLADVPLTPPSHYLPSSFSHLPSGDWFFKLPFDPAKNSKGFAGKKPPPAESDQPTIQRQQYHRLRLLE